MNLCIAALLVCSLLGVTRADYGEMLAPPHRPAEFKSPQQLRAYLHQLNEYYSIMGRPRFGKRGDAFVKKGLFADPDYNRNDASWEDFQQ